MITIPDGATKQRPRMLTRLAFHGSAGLAAVLCAGLVGHFMMKSGDNPVATTPAPATAQIYVLPDDEHPEEATSATEAAQPREAVANVQEAPTVARASDPIPPKPLAKPAVASCSGASCESWESIVNKALTEPSRRQAQPAAIQASAPGNAVPLDPVMTNPVTTDAMPEAAPREIQREGPTSIGSMARSATTSAAATVVTQSSKLVDNLMRWSDTAVSSVGIGRTHTPPEPLPN